MDMYHRYFIYSAIQKKDKEKIYKQANKTYMPGSVMVKGYSKPFTDIVLKIENCPYSDAQVVIQGDIRKISYTPPTR